MAEPLDPKDLVTIEDLAISHVGNCRAGGGKEIPFALIVEIAPLYYLGYLSLSCPLVRRIDIPHTKDTLKMKG